MKTLVLQSLPRSSQFRFPYGTPLKIVYVTPGCLSYREIFYFYSMSIRIREVDGHTVALCAALTEPREGDIYLDDAAHHALSTKFDLDAESMGFMFDPPVDKLLIPIMRKEQNGRLV